MDQGRTGCGHASVSGHVGALVSFALSAPHERVVEYCTQRGLETLSVRVSVWHAIDAPWCTEAPRAVPRLGLRDLQ